MEIFSKEIIFFIDIYLPPIFIFYRDETSVFLKTLKYFERDDSFQENIRDDICKIFNFILGKYFLKNNFKKLFQFTLNFFCINFIFIDYKSFLLKEEYLEEQ